jgi:hypothetical protein
VIRRLESVHRLENELLGKLAHYDTEVARRKRFAAPPWDETDPTQDSIAPASHPWLDTLEERVE